MTAVAQAQREEADAQLLHRVTLGDLGGLGVLFDRYHGDVLRYVGRLGVSPGDADDLVQLTFLDVMRAAQSFDGRSSARAWLFGLATMVVRRHRTSLGRLATRLLAWAREPQPESNESPVEQLARHQDAAHAHRALERLSAKKQEVFVLVVLENATGEEAARALGIPVATVWTRLHHARRELRQLLAEDLP